ETVRRGQRGTARTSGTRQRLQLQAAAAGHKSSGENRTVVQITPPPTLLRPIFLDSIFGRPAQAVDSPSTGDAEVGRGTCLSDQDVPATAHRVRSPNSPTFSGMRIGPVDSIYTAFRDC